MKTGPETPLLENRSPTSPTTSPCTAPTAARTTRFRRGSPVLNARPDAPAQTPTTGPPASAAATRNGPASETRVRRPTRSSIRSASAVSATRTIATAKGMRTSAPPAPAVLSPDRGNLRAEQEVGHGLAADVARPARLHRVAGARHDDQLPARREGELLPRPGQLRRQVVSALDEQRRHEELAVRRRRRRS